MKQVSISDAAKMLNVGIRTASAARKVHRDGISELNQAMDAGEIRAKPAEAIAKGRTDADFAELIGMGEDGVYERRRVWETFSDVSGMYRKLK